MDYPNDFNIKSFPAGKTIAFSRSVSIWIAIVFFLIIAMCGFVLLFRRFQTNYPFLISVDPYTDDWTVITYPGKNEKEPIQQYQIVQEKLVRDFVTDWFTISDNATTNEKRWKACEIEDCSKNEQFNPDNIECAIYCKSDEAVFAEFTKNVLPDYSAYAEASGKWTVGNMLITPNTKSIKPTFGEWQVVTTIHTAANTSFNVLTFITIAQDQHKYPATLGYYIKAFNAYRITDE